MLRPVGEDAEGTQRCAAHASSAMATARVRERAARKETTRTALDFDRTARTRSRWSGSHAIALERLRATVNRPMEIQRLPTRAPARPRRVQPVDSAESVGSSPSPA